MLSKLLTRWIIYFLLFEMLIVLDYILEIIIPCVYYLYTQVL